jgi:ribonuclease P protein component
MVWKKVEKSAVKRNRIKRIFKSAFLNILKKEIFLWNFLFIPSINTLNKKSFQIEKEIFNLFKKIF